MPTKTAERPVYRAKGAIVRLALSTDREVLIDGPANTGKSVGVASFLASECETWPNLRCLVVRLTRKSLSESFVQSFENIVMPRGHPVIARRITPTNRHSYDWEKTGARIVLGSMDNAEAFFSTEWDYVVYEELIQGSLEQWLKFHRAMRNRRRPHPDIAVRFPEYLGPDHIIDAIKLRNDFEAGKFEKYKGMMPDGVTPVWKHQMIGVTNPGDENSWIIKRALAGKMRRFQSTHADNPSFGQEERAQLEQLEGVLRDRLYLGIWRSAEGAIWPQFSREKHCLPHPAKKKKVRVEDKWEEHDVPLEGRELLAHYRKAFGIVRYAVGVDWGYTDPGCMTVFGIDAEGRMYRVFEVYRTGLTVGGDVDAPDDEDDWIKVAKRIQTMWKPEVFVCDSASRAYIELMRKAGLHAVGVTKGSIGGKGFIAAGLDLVRNRLRSRDGQRPMIMWITDGLESRDKSLESASLPLCSEDEIPSYCHKRDAVSGTVIDGVPAERQPDHGCDAVRYVTMYVDGFVRYDRLISDEDVESAETAVAEPLYSVKLVHLGETLPDLALQRRDIDAIDMQTFDEDDGPWSLWCKLEWDRRAKMYRPHQLRTYVVAAAASPVGQSTMIVACRETREQVAQFSAEGMSVEDFAREMVRACVWFGGAGDVPLAIWRGDTPYGAAFGQEVVWKLRYSAYYRDINDDRTDSKRSSKFGWISSTPKMADLAERFRAALRADQFVPKSQQLVHDLSQYIWFNSGKIGPQALEESDAAAMLTHADLVLPAMLCHYAMGIVGLVRAPKRKAPIGSKAWVEEQEQAKEKASKRAWWR